MAAPSAPLVVVGPQFCTPHTLPLTLAMKCNGSWTVDDAVGAVVLQMDRIPLFSFRRRYVLLDAAGVPVVSLKAKVFRGDSNDAGDLLFTATASSLGRWPFRGLDVFLAGNTRRGAADFKTKGDFRRSGYFYHGDSDKMIASMNRMKYSSGRPVFGVTVFPHADHAFIIALVLISHYVYSHIEREKRRQENR